MNKQEAIEAINSELEGLLEYAERVREDWSDFDGRSLLSRVEGFRSRVKQSLAVLE